jgi:hypothetical protein
MNVSASGSISLSGALSRNFAIKTMVPGDIVEVRVLKMLGTSSAIVDLKGNKVQLDFTSPPPPSGSFVLELLSSKNDRLTFKMRSGGNDCAEILKYLPLSPKDVSPANMKEILRHMQSGIPGMFTLHLLMSGAKGESKGRDILPMLKYLLLKGLKPGEIPYVSAKLSGFTEGQSKLLNDIINTYTQPVSDEETERMKDDLQFVEDILAQNSEKYEKSVFFAGDQSLKRIDFFVHENYFSGRIELPHVGQVEFFLRIAEKPDILIVCEDECLGEMTESIQDLSSDLNREYTGAIVRVMPVSLIRKKVLAFVGSMTERSFDARA